MNNDNSKFEIIFESVNIYFVKLSEALINDYLEMVNNEEVQKYISHNRKKYNFDEEIEWIKSKLKNDAFVFSMIEKESGEFIGNIEIMKINNNIGELGISITPKKQDRHYGQEALITFMEYSINTLNLDGLELNVFDFNSRAIHCYEKVGFCIDGAGKTNNDLHMIYIK